MKMNLKIFLPAVVVMMFALSMTGNAHDRHNDSGENKAAITLENPIPAPEPYSLVSRWLEARLADELPVMEVMGGKYAFEPAWILDVEEGCGWCDACGCWFKHGCDPNGNCQNGHGQVCSGPGAYCDWHGTCVSSG
jgi:hypothetical protein